MENEDIFYGCTGKKPDCKTRARSTYFMSSFWKCMIRLKTFEATYKIFSKTCSCQYMLFFCWPNKSLWNLVYGISGY